MMVEEEGGAEEGGRLQGMAQEEDLEEGFFPVNFNRQPRKSGKQGMAAPR